MINGFGALVTGVVLIVVAVTKALEGAWIVLLLIPLIVIVFPCHAASLRHVAARLTLKGWASETRVVRTRCWSRSAAYSVPWSSRRVRRNAVGRRPGGLRRRGSGVPNSCGATGNSGAESVQLVVLASPYRSLMEPLLEYIERVDRGAPGRLRHGGAAGVRAGAAGGTICSTTRRALLIKGALLFTPEYRRHKRAVSSFKWSS